ncbi:unnamed protein product [Rotaria sordida]|uniref:EF-hand domain-containing protein n=1 Tax=Rotaria sordida TaxID=392033 RepID=A0A818M0P8_9BILA|nr:unnamed protein product [Rotaria sordida]CAF3577523.1 unnamed protein product [Rotaria sordida]
MNDMDKVRYKEAFLLMDEKNSGVITIDDIHFLIRALGFTPTKNDLENIDREFNDNKNIDYLWFIDIMSTISCRKYSYEQIEKAFFSFDKNRYVNDIFLGLINVETFKKAMMTMGESLSENEMNEMMKDLPIDEDGFIEYEHYLLQFKPKENLITLKTMNEEKK